MTSQVVIRRYEPRDRKAVREICCDTADRGGPVEAFFPDREVFADLVTRYYTDCEPQSTWVAERDGEVVGYLTGCLDTRRLLRVMTWRLVPLALIKALVRGALWHSQVLRLLGANLSRWLKGDFRPGVSLRDYPAHLHINLRKDNRGQQIGRQLTERFLEQARHAGASGVHARVSSRNERGQRFFESSGFGPLVREGPFRSPAAPEQEMFTVIYGRRL